MTFGFVGVASAHKSPPHHSPVRIELFGDSTALTLGWSLNALDSKYDYFLLDQGFLGCGVVMGPEAKLLDQTVPIQPACNGATPAPGTALESQPWPVQWKTSISKFHPNVVVLLAGRWEDVDRVYNGQWTNILSPTFASYVKQQLEFASNLVTATGANMVFMTAPCTYQGKQLDGTPWPEDSSARLAVYNGLVRQVAAEYPTTDSVVDLNAIVCPGGKFTSKFRGATIRRPDGVHFTTTAGIHLGSVLMPAIVASGRAQMARTAKAGTG